MHWLTRTTSRKENLLTLSGEELIQKLNSTDLANLPHPKGPGKNWSVAEIVCASILQVIMGI